MQTKKLAKRKSKCKTSSDTLPKKKEGEDKNGQTMGEAESGADNVKRRHECARYSLKTGPPYTDRVGRRPQRVRAKNIP